MIGTAAGSSTGVAIALPVGLAFLFGYALSTLPLIRAGLGFGAAVVFAAPDPRVCLDPLATGWFDARST